MVGERRTEKLSSDMAVPNSPLLQMEIVLYARTVGNCLVGLGQNMKG
jgi:hypothetical protein